MLTTLCLLLAALLLLVLPAALGLMPLLRLGSAMVMAGMAVLAVLALLAPSAEVMALPLGPPWAAALVALDPLSAWFLLLLGLTGAFAALLGQAREDGLVGFHLKRLLDGQQGMLVELG